jgi:hypothetical protein
MEQMKSTNAVRTATPTEGRRRRRLVSTTLLASGLVLSVGALSACSGSSGSSASMEQSQVGAAAAGAPEKAADSLTSMYSKDAPASGAGPSVLQDVPLSGRALVTQASMSVDVDDVEQARAQVLVITSGNGGYIESEETSSGPTDATSHTVSVLVVRVPQPRTGAVLDRLRQLGTVTSFDQSTTDVTTKVADVEARVRSAEASVRRIRALLSSAQTIGQVVTIESQLAQRQSDLESLQAQQRALADATTNSTITVSLTTRSSTVVAASGTGFLTGLRNGWDAFTGVISGALTAFGWLVPFAAFLGLLAVVLLGVVRLARRRATHLT